MTAELAVKAVENACLNVKSAEGIILHSDLRVQYTSQKFEVCVKAKHMIHSFRRKGNPYDNSKSLVSCGIMLFLSYFLQRADNPHPAAQKC